MPRKARWTIEVVDSAEQPVDVEGFALLLDGLATEAAERRADPALAAGKELGYIGTKVERNRGTTKEPKGPTR